MTSHRRLLLVALVVLGRTGSACAADVVFRALAVDEAPVAARTTAPIYNGSPTQAFPAVVAVGIFNADGSSAFCSGTLITPTVVLTAGHCLSFGATHAAIAVFPDGVTEVDRPAFAAAVHPDFDLGRIAVDDVGILVVDPPITGVTPAPLAAAAPRPRVRATIVGFGDDPRATNGVKRVGTVRLARCPRAVRKVGIAQGQLDGSLCWRPKRRGQDTCVGDSGGPLLVGGAVAGVTSGGFPDCPGKLSWDTSVAAVRDWIDAALARASTLTPASVSGSIGD
jgi:secreted trypsin-like serine protease